MYFYHRVARYYDEKVSRRTNEVGDEVATTKYVRKWFKTNLWTLRDGTQADRRQQNVVQVERVLASLMRDDLQAKASALIRLVEKADRNDPHKLKRAGKLSRKASLVAETLTEWAGKGPSGPKEFVSTLFRQTLDTWREETEVAAEAWAAAAAEAGNNCSDHNDEGADKQAPSSQQHPRQPRQATANPTRGKLGVEVAVRSMAAAASTSQQLDQIHAVDVRITHCSSTSVTGVVVGSLYDGVPVEVNSTDLFEIVVRGGDCVMVPRHNMTVGSTHHLFVCSIDRSRRGTLLHCAVKKPVATRRTKRVDGKAKSGTNNNAHAKNVSPFQVGDKVQGVVTRHTHFGAFVRVAGWPRDGLVHASAVQRGVRHGDFASLLPIGSAEVVCWVHSVDRKHKKLGLGLFPPKASVQDVVKSTDSAENARTAEAAPEDGVATKPKNCVSSRPVSTMDDLVEAQRSGRLLEGRVAKYINSQQDAIIEIGRAGRSVRITASANMLRTYAAPGGRFTWDIATVLPAGAWIDVRVVEADVSRKRCTVAPASAKIFFEESCVAEAANSSAGNADTMGLNFFQRIPHRVLTMVWGFLGQSYSSWRGQPQLRRPDPANGKWHTFKQFVATYGPRAGGIKWQEAWNRSCLTRTKVTSGVDDPVPDCSGCVRDCVALASTCSFLLHSCPRAAEHHDANTICCFHTRKNHTQATLGFGLNLEFYPRAAGDKSPARLAYVHTTSDIISYDAYEAHGLRQNLWKAPFTHWFPAFIDDVHWHRGGRVAANAMLAKIFGVDVATVAKTPELVLELVPKVLNTMVLSIMKGVSHASIAALHAYCQWAHVLTGFCQEYPGVQAAIDAKVRGFVSSEFGRNKYNCPALGEFLPLLLFTNKYSWADVAADYLSETFDRNSKWILAKHPELNDTCAELTRRTKTQEGTVAHGTSQARIGKSFACSQTSMRLLCFHVALLRSFDFIRRGSQEVDAQSMARFQCHRSPSSPVNGLLPTSRLKAYFDRTNGRTTPELEKALQNEIFKIQEIGKLPGVRWAEVFAYLRLPCPSDAYLSSWLRCSMRNSGRRHYHQRDAMKDMLEEATDRERRSRERLKERMQKLDDGFDENDQYYDAVADTRSSRGW